MLRDKFFAIAKVLASRTKKAILAVGHLGSHRLILSVTFLSGLNHEVCTMSYGLRYLLSLIMLRGHPHRKKLSST